MNIRPLIPLLLASLAVAQSPLASPASAIDRSCGAGIGDDGACWLGGPDYKALFVDGAFEFVPALGSSAPHNLPWTFALQSVAIGAQVLGEGGGATPTIAGNVATIPRGAVSERYEVMAAGVEQSFVVERRPDAEGDLVVRGAITTSLQPRPRADGGIDFTDGEHGGVSVGAVTGVDANGARCAGSATFANGVLELRLPANFVAVARFPLTLDPLVGTVILPGGTAFDDSEIDLAYAATSNVYLATWRRTFSFTDQDIRAQRIDSAGNLVGGLIAVVATATPEARPSVASIRTRDRFVVAWQQSASPFGPWAVAARTIDAATGALAAQVTVSGNGDSVAVCGDRNLLLGSQAIFAMHVDSYGIVVFPGSVSAAGVITIGAPNVIAEPNYFDGPRITRSVAAGQTAVVVWQSLTIGYALKVSGVAYGGAPVGAVSAPVGGSASPMQYSIDGDGTHNLMVHQFGGFLDGALLDWDGSGMVSSGATTFPNSIGASAPAVAWLGDRYLAAWQGQTSNPFSGVVRYKVFDGACHECGLEHTVSGAFNPSHRRPAVVSQYSGNGLTGEAMLAWAENTLTLPLTSVVAAQRFQRLGGVAPQLLSTGCAGGGSTTTNSPFALGNAGMTFQLTGADPSAPFALLSLSDGSLPAVTCGCDLTQPLVLDAALSIGGNAEIPFVVPCNATLLGFGLEYQWLLFGASSSPCPFVPGLVGGDRMRLILSE